mmetsp:Transcript_67971/g.141928  ORF Transcript_67971/g.141928 Transcript_67971/m.141928 type:complete len:209 (+) Transcript_67971:692-1318(+)
MGLRRCRLPNSSVFSAIKTCRHWPKWWAAAAATVASRTASCSLRGFHTQPRCLCAQTFGRIQGCILTLGQSCASPHSSSRSSSEKVLTCQSCRKPWRCSSYLSPGRGERSVRVLEVAGTSRTHGLAALLGWIRGFSQRSGINALIRRVGGCIISATTTRQPPSSTPEDALMVGTCGFPRTAMLTSCMLGLCRRPSKTRGACLHTLSQL